MENVYKELDNVKAEMERLEAELRVEKEVCETLKKSNSQQLIKFQEAKGEVEKQARELNVKLEEISQVRQVSESLQSCLHEKESSLRQLTSLYEKLRADRELKLKKLEGENRELAFAFDEVSEKNKELEQNACASGREIEALKRRLLTTEKKYLEAEKKAEAAKDLRLRDEMIIKLEEENRNSQDQLKWKKEQFKHLEEAHRRLQVQFASNKEEWERSKSAMLEEISLLQTSLDSKSCILDDVQKLLEMCKQALAHEESRRKFLEVEVSEFKSRYENVFAQCQEERSKFESLTVQRDEEIGKLRNLLGTKHTSTKEKEIRMAHLEQENQELRESLKELRESEIRNAGASSLTKLQNKLRDLEQVHSNCSRNLKQKESEWSSQVVEMKENLIGYNSELKGKEKQIQESQLELESCHSMIEVLSEEISIILAIFKSEFLEALSKKSDPKAEVEAFSKKGDDNISVLSLLTTQLEMKDGELRNVLLKLEQEHEQVKIMMKRVRSLELTEKRQKNLEEQLQRHQLYLDDQFLLMEGEKRDISETLERVNLELAEKVRESSQLEDELKSWKSSTERLKISCEENQEKCRQMENSLLLRTENEKTLKRETDSLLSTIEVQNNKIEVLQQRIGLLAATVAAKTREVEACTQDKENTKLNAKYNDCCIEELRKDIAWLEQECLRREMEAAIFASFDAEKCVKKVKEKLFKVINEKDQNIQSLENYAISLEQDMTSLITSSFSEVVENLVTINALTETLKKSEHMLELQTEERNMKVGNLEKEVAKLIHQEEALFFLKQQVRDLESLFEAKKLETNKLMMEQKILEGIVKQLESEKTILLQDSRKLSKEREHTLLHLEEFCDRISELTYEDTGMMDVLETMLQGFKEEVGPAMGLTVDDSLYDYTQENESTTIYASSRKLEASSAGRLPLKEMNHQEGC